MASSRAWCLFHPRRRPEIGSGKSGFTIIPLVPIQNLACVCPQHCSVHVLSPSSSMHSLAVLSPGYFTRTITMSRALLHQAPSYALRPRTRDRLFLSSFLASQLASLSCSMPFPSD